MKTKHIFHRYLIAGLLVWVPIAVTLWVMAFFVDILDKTLELLPHSMHPDVVLGFHLPGLGVIFTVLIVFFTGMAVTNILGNKLIYWGEAILGRIPLVRTIYSAVKQVVNTVFAPSGESFRKVLLVQYPRIGMWTIAFQTNNGLKEAENHLQEKLLTVFIPTTPNPTSGFIILVPQKDILELKMTVDEALKMVISLGVMVPNPTEFTNTINQVNQ